MLACIYCGITERQASKGAHVCLHGRESHMFEPLPEPGTDEAELIPNLIEVTPVKQEARIKRQLEKANSPHLDWQPSHKPRPVSPAPCDVMPDRKVTQERLDAYVQAALAGVDPIAQNRTGCTHARLAVETAIEALNLVDRIMLENGK